MTVEGREHENVPLQPPPSWQAEDSIDLREYVETIIRWRMEIVAFGVLASLVTALTMVALQFMSVPLYTAEATVAVVRVTSDISFDERFRTSSDDASIASGTGARRSALLSLVKSGAIANAVIEEVSAQLPDIERDPAKLLSAIEAATVDASGRPIGDLIVVRATSKSPTTAALLANAWAKHYVREVNTVYGQVPEEVLESVATEVLEAEVLYNSALGELEEFVASNQVNKLNRQINEKRGIINSLQSARQTAVDTIVNEEVRARSDVIAAYIQAQSENRLLAFTAEQDAKNALVRTYIDAQVQARIRAVEKDQEARTSFFEHFADGQLESTLAVFDEQIRSKIVQLRYAYVEKSRMSGILEQAKLMKEQIDQAGDAATENNRLSLLLLKAQIFTMANLDSGTDILADDPLSSFSQATGQTNDVEDESPDSSSVPLLNAPIVSAPTINIAPDDSASRAQLNFDLTLDTNSTSADQLAEVTVIVNTLEAHLAQLERIIETLSELLVSGNGYQLLDQLGASTVGVSAPFSGTLELTNLDNDNLALSQQVMKRYLEMFEIGGIAEQAEEISTDSDLFVQLTNLYPDLFTLGALSELTNDVPDDNPLAMISFEKAQQLLQLQGLEDIPSYSASAEPLLQAIDKLERESQALDAKLELESAKELQLTQLRDLAWESFKTLSAKAAELNLAQSATNSEVRLAAPAVVPADPVDESNFVVNIVLAGIAGLLLATLLGLFADFMGREPFFSRRTSLETGNQ